MKWLILVMALVASGCTGAASFGAGQQVVTSLAQSPTAVCSQVIMGDIAALAQIKSQLAGAPAVP